jgi:hypothetical protein
LHAGERYELGGGGLAYADPWRAAPAVDQLMFGDVLRFAGGAHPGLPWVAT